MAKQQRDRGREQFWRDLVSEWHVSGLSVREFCSQRHVKEASFYSWRRELQRREAPSASSAPATFVPVTVVPTMAMVEVRCPSGHVVTVANADRDTLRHLFAALVAEAPC
jgi:transposase-like protein